MAVVVIKDYLSKELLRTARQDYKNYVKITIDIKQEIVALGGEYHADAERVLLKEYNSSQDDIWGGGYDLLTKQFETNALLNIRPRLNNTSSEILDPKIRQKFISIATIALSDINKLL